MYTLGECTWPEMAEKGPEVAGKGPEVSRKRITPSCTRMGVYIYGRKMAPALVLTAPALVLTAPASVRTAPATVPTAPASALALVVTAPDGPSVGPEWPKMARCCRKMIERGKKVRPVEKSVERANLHAKRVKSRKKMARALLFLTWGNSGGGNPRRG
jgi:hypothetical protein